MTVYGLVVQIHLSWVITGNYRGRVWRVLFFFIPSCVSDAHDCPLENIERVVTQ
jgi:hypothetical protein